jgi:hypothetical protein
MKVIATLPYDDSLKGKLQHRVCSKCESRRDTIINELGKQTNGRIVATKEDNRPRLFNLEELDIE